MSKRFQLVGSLLRPADLLEYKRNIENRDDITYPFYDDFEGYQQCEAKSIESVVAKEIEHGITILTDGEHSRSLWHLDFVWGLAGVERFIADQGYIFRDKDESQVYETRRDVGVNIVGELSGKNHHFITLYKQLQELAGDRDIKLCIPSPSHIYGELLLSENHGAHSYYKTKEDLKAGLARAYREFIEEYAEIGGKIVQFDDCLWTLFADDNPNSPFTVTNDNQAEQHALAYEFIDLNNELIAFGHSKGLKVWTHNCRGNYDSRHMAAGSYERIAHLFLEKQNYDRFFLEWDDERAGSLDALNAFKDKPNTEVVLGFLSSKTNTLDDEDRVFKLLEEAAKIVDKDRLYLSHQCGFASCDGGNELTDAEQWAKIDQGQKLALEYWGE